MIFNVKSHLKKLISNLSVQDYSCCLMHFTIQDLLDYAQIKADKFRKNISKINIIETTKKVVAMQQRQADEKDIKLFIEFDNIDELNNYDSQNSL